MRLLLCGGGTEGHIAPSLALAQQMEKSGDAFLFVVRKDGPENKKITNARYPYIPINIKSMSEFPLYQKVKFLSHLKIALRECRNIIESFKRDAIFATGGYVSLAPVIAGHEKKIPIYLHESNAIPGDATRILLKHTHTLFLGMPNSKANFKRAKRLLYVGTPTKKEFYETNRSEARKKLGLGEEFMILSFGGSLGALKLNDACFEVMEEYSSKNNLIHIHVTGKRYYEKAKEAHPKFFNSNGKCRAVSFIENIYDYMASADLVICRAGAGTISELLASGSYPVLIPSPNVKKNHQMLNARLLCAKTKTPLIPESEHLKDDLIMEIEYAIRHPEDCVRKRRILRSLSTPLCAENILEEIRRNLQNM